MAEELQFHRSLKERELQDAGLSEADARRAAAVAIGNVTLAREDARAAWRFAWLDDAVRDLRYAVRSLRTQPGFTIAATLALVLGIGLNAIVFSVYNTLALAPWMIRDGDRAVQVYVEAQRGMWSGMSWPQYRYLASHTQTLQGLAGYTLFNAQMKRGDGKWDASIAAVSDNYFELLGTGFQIGRGFSKSADYRRPEPEAILEHNTWRSQFGGDPNIVGTWLDTSGGQQRLRIVGVALEGFDGANPVAPQMWVAAGWRDILQPDGKSIDNAGMCCMKAVGIRKPETSMGAAQAELQVLSRQFNEEIRRDPSNVLVTSAALLANPSIARQATPVFLAAGIAALLVLLLACANVANLQIARALGRRREIAVRLSLGAGQGRILRQLFTESLVLTSLAGTIGILLNIWAPKWIVQTMAPERLTTALRFATDYRVAVFIAAVTFLAALISGLIPATRIVREAIASGLQEGQASPSGMRLRSVLLGSQVALCAVLLSTAMLLARALESAKTMEPGFAYQNILLFAPNLSSSGFDDAKAVPMLRELTTRIQALPGVEAVAHASSVPLGRRSESSVIQDPSNGERRSAGIAHVSANYFATLGIPLVNGRGFSTAEEALDTSIVVNDALVKSVRPGSTLFDRTIIGTAATVSWRELGSKHELFAYMPSNGTAVSQLIIRHAPGAGDAIARALPGIAAEVDKRIAPTVTPYTTVIGDARYSAIVAAAVAGILSSLALLLACVGIYGVTAYNVSQRTREIGVRIALGANRSSILALVFGQNLRTIAAGAVIGAAGAYAFARLLSSLLFGVQPGDPLALLSAAGLLMAAAAIAVFAPARRASVLDPSITLRQE
ncbi:hypothetical protein F183_A53270 [Bryobacterales bacterium F-183]|nr:hypothetical protein F183_A53270 [Bryobacterales bacterium F-183]